MSSLPSLGIAGYVVLNPNGYVFYPRQTTMDVCLQTTDDPKHKIAPRVLNKKNIHTHKSHVTAQEKFHWLCSNSKRECECFGFDRFDRHKQCYRFNIFNILLL